MEKFLILSGSASRDCPALKLDRAISFVQVLTRRILLADGGLVVLIGDEMSATMSDKRARVFDGTVLREVEDYVNATTQGPRTFAHVIMSDRAWQTKLSSANRQTLANLEKRKAVEVHRIRRGEYTGGKYRDIGAKLANGMIAIGGGKGTYSLGKNMIDLGKPVLPLDISIGSFSDDGRGALDLHEELQRKPSDFFPATYTIIINEIETLSLETDGVSVDEVAQRALEVLSRELAHDVDGWHQRIKRLAVQVQFALRKFLSVIGILRALEFLRNLFFLI